MPQNLKPLHHMFAEQNMMIVDGLYQATQLEIDSHKETLSILQQVVKGTLNISRVVVNDDGVKVMPEPPKPMPVEVNPDG